MERNRSSENNAVSVSEPEQISFGSFQREQALEMLERTNIDELTDSECRELLRDMLSSINKI